MTKHVAVLMGGFSEERDVSLASGKACADALRRAGYRVSELDVDKNFLNKLHQTKPDVCFNALHGKFGEDGTIQGILELMGVPYTHSGVRASSIAMDKPITKLLVSTVAIPSPIGQVMHKNDVIGKEPMKRPFVIKPPDEGSSVGVMIYREQDNTPLLTAEDWPFGDTVLVETFVPGRELTVAVLNGEALCVTEIMTGNQFYDYEAKYSAGGSNHVLPADIPQDTAESAMAMAEKVHALLGCRGVSRTDFRMDPDGKLWFLEVNTQPGMTGTSLVPEQAQYRGVSFEDLCTALVEDASCNR